MRMPIYVREILKKLNDAGYKAYAVGGCVRDCLLSRQPNDWDITTSAFPETVQELFPKTVPTGVKYGTVTVISGSDKCEVTTFRTDGEYKDYRKPELVEFVCDVKEDLMRRDFTMNAMAMDINGGIVDPFGGCEDTEKRIIRCVGEPERRFSEDALRMLRAVRFSAVLGFKIEENTLLGISRLSSLASKLSAERVRDELIKLLKSPKPEYAEILIRLGLLDAYTRRTDISLAMLGQVPAEENMRFLTLAYMLEKAGAIDSGAMFLKALRMTKNDVSRYLDASNAARIYAKDAALFTAINGRDTAMLAAQFIGGDVPHQVKKAIDSGHIITEKELVVDGDFIKLYGFTGERIGKMKKLLAALVSTGKIQNNADDICKVLDEYSVINELY